MDIRIESVERFRKAFDAVARVIPPKSPKPILQSALIRADADGVSIVGTNLELSASRHLAEGVEVAAPGAATIPAARLAAVLRAADQSAPLRIAAEGAEVAITAGDRSTIKLAVEDPDLFPLVEFPAVVNGFRVPAGDLARLAKLTAFAIDEGSTRFAMGGVLFHRELLTLNAVGTDGRRLSRAWCLFDAIGDPAAVQVPASPMGPIVPAGALKILATLLADAEPDAPVDFGADDRAASFCFGPTRLRTRLIEGRFPRYQDVFPDGVPKTAKVGAGMFRCALALAATVATEESRGIDFDLGDGVARLSARSADVGASDVAQGVEYGGPPVGFTLDSGFVLQGLGAMEPSATVTVDVIDAKSPVVFRTEGWDYVVMPMTRG